MREARASVRVLLALAIGAGAAAPAGAAETAPDPDLSTQQMRRAGPVYVQPVAVLKDVGYDTNIRFESPKAEGDTTATVGGAVGLLFLAGNRGGVRLFQEADYVGFGANTDLNHWNGTSRARGVLLLKRAQLSLEDLFTSVQERPTTEIDQRVRREDHGLTAEMKSRGQSRFGARAWLREERIAYSSREPGIEDIGDKLNRVEGTLAVIGEARLLPKTTFTLEGDVQRYDFEDRSLGRDSRSTSILPGVRFDPSASIQGEIKVGSIAFEAPDQPENNYHGLVADSAVSARLGHAARLKGTYARGLVFSLLGGNLFFVSDAWTAAYEQFFSRRLSGEVLYGRGLDHYPQPVPIAGPPAFTGIRDDRLTTYGATVRYRLNDQLTLTATAKRLVRDSSDDSLDRRRDFYALGTAYAF
jgi:putative beta-barrel porin BBP2